MIESLGVYLPEKEVSTQEIMRGCAKRILVPLERLTGIRSRRVAADNEFAVDLARNAARECLDRSKHAAAEVDLLICATISRLDGPQRFSFEPSTAMRLRRDLGCDRALAFDITNACAGMFSGIFIADAMIRSAAIRTAMIVSGEYITHLTRTAQKELAGMFDPRLACLTLGDAGAAVMLARGTGDDAGFHAIDLYTLGQYSDCCVAKPTDKPHGGAIMITDMVKLATIGLRHSLQHAAYTVARLRWPAEAIQHVLPHQTSSTTIEAGSKEVGRLVSDASRNYSAKVINNVAQRGNTATTSHFVALDDCFRQGRIKTGESVLFGVTASGITIGTALYRFDDLPERMQIAGAARKEEGGRRKDENSAFSLQPSAFSLSPGPAPPQHFLAADRGPRVCVESIGTLDLGAAGPKDTMTLLTAAATACLADSAFDRLEIDLLLNASTYRTDFLSEPAIATMLAGAMHINDAVNNQLQKKTLAFDVINGALGFLNAVYFAGELIRAGRCHVAMVAAAEIENNARVAPDRLLGLSETGSAVLLVESKDGRTGFGSFFFKSYPEHFDALETFGSFGTATAGMPAAPYLVFTRRADLERYWLDCAADSVAEFLAAEGLELAQIGLFLPPQVSPGFVCKLAARLGVPADRTVSVATQGRDLFTSSIPYTLQAAIRERKPAPGTIGLIVGVASGLQVGCALYHF